MLRRVSWQSQCRSFFSTVESLMNWRWGREKLQLGSATLLSQSAPRPHPRHETSRVSPWSGMQNRRNCNSITPTCTDTSYRVYLMNIEKSFRFLLSLSLFLFLLHASSSDARLINVETMERYLTLYGHMQHMTHEKWFHRSNVRHIPLEPVCIHAITKYWLK